MQVFRLLVALCSLSGLAMAQELAFPLTARLQSRIPSGGIAADAYYLPGSAQVSCFEATPSGSRFPRRRCPLPAPN